MPHIAKPTFQFKKGSYRRKLTLTVSCDRVVNSAGSSALYGKFENSDGGFPHHVQSAFRPRKHRGERLTEVFRR